MGFQSMAVKQFLALLSAVLFLALLSSGVVTWVAVNWQSISPNYKVLLVQGVLLLIGISLFTLRLRAEQRVGSARASHDWWYQGLAFLGAVVSGALIALVGQVYQTGADTWLLFAVWLVLILPWFVFSPNVFVAVLAVVVANTAALLFLQDSQLLISRSTAVYVLAAFNALLFVGLEHKWAKYDALWAALSTTVLICAITIFATARIGDFSDAISLHLLIAAALLVMYVALNGGALRIKVSIVAVIAAALSACLIEMTVGAYQHSSRFAFILFMIGLVWGAAAFVILFLWRSLSKLTKTLEANKQGITRLRQQPTPIAVFLIMSSLIVAAFFYLAFYMTVHQNYENQLMHFTSELSIALLLLALASFYLRKGGVFAYGSVVCYVFAVFICIERYFSNYYFESFGGQAESTPWLAYIAVFVGLIVSALIYRVRTESWVRFVVSLGFFVFLSLLPAFSYVPWLTSKAVLLPLIFIALLLWSFKDAKPLSHPLFSAFILWAFYVVVTHHYRVYGAIYTESSFKGVLLAFLTPFKQLSELSDLSGMLVASRIFYLVLTVILSLVPLWVLCQITKHQGRLARVVAFLIGLLVAWLWFGRIEIIITFSLMVLAYQHKSRSLYYSAVVLGLFSLSMFYFSLHVSLEQKAYLLLFSGGLFLVLYLVFAKRLLVDDEKLVQAAEAQLSTRSEVAETDAFKLRIAPLSRLGFYGLLALSVLLPLTVSQWQTSGYERILRSGQSVLLRLQPVDPRSLMQGDYMVINYELTGTIQRELERSIIHENTSANMSDRLEKSLSLSDGVRFLAEVKMIDGVAEQPVAFYEPHEVTDFRTREGTVYLPFVLKSESTRYVVSPSFSTDFFFNEGAASAYEQARFVELAVGEGRVMLRALLDIDRNKIETATKE